MFPPGYFPQAYFPPGYFPAPGGPTAPGAGPGAYFPLGYFPPAHFPPGYFPTSAPVVLYDGPDVLDALQAWWTDRPDLHALLAPFEFDDGPRSCLWHLEAPEGQDPPFAVVFLVSEDESEARTTGFATLLAVLQINVHAATDLEAKAIRKAIRKAVRGAPLAVDGLPVRHVLPAGQGLQVGEGFLRGGRDSWVATLEVEVPHDVDYDS